MVTFVSNSTYTGSFQSPISHEFLCSFVAREPSQHWHVGRGRSCCNAARGGGDLHDCCASRKPKTDGVLHGYCCEHPSHAESHVMLSVVSVAREAIRMLLSLVRGTPGSAAEALSKHEPLRLAAQQLQPCALLQPENLAPACTAKGQR